jgi:hypothetical protein
VACQLDFVSNEVDAMEPMLPFRYDERTDTLRREAEQLRRARGRPRVRRRRWRFRRHQS